MELNTLKRLIGGENIGNFTFFSGKQSTTDFSSFDVTLNAPAGQTVVLCTLTNKIRLQHPATTIYVNDEAISPTKTLASNEFASNPIAVGIQELTDDVAGAGLDVVVGEKIRFVGGTEAEGARSAVYAYAYMDKNDPLKLDRESYRLRQTIPAGSSGELFRLTAPTGYKVVLLSLEVVGDSLSESNMRLAKDGAAVINNTLMSLGNAQAATSVPDGSYAVGKVRGLSSKVTALPEIYGDVIVLTKTTGSTTNPIRYSYCYAKKV